MLVSGARWRERFGSKLFLGCDIMGMEEIGGGRKYTGNTRPLLRSRPRRQEQNLQRIRRRNSKTPTGVELVCYRDGWVEGTFFCTSS